MPSTAQPGDRLSPEHRRMLEEESRISPAIIEQRGYFSATTKQQAKDLGFSTSQARPGLVLPVYSLNGEHVGYQLRPDEPRQLKGKLVKYETPSKARAVPDIHPSMRDALDDPSVPLFITEGIKKGDSAASIGVACIALTGGVWGFRGTNPQGGKTVHPELRQFVAWKNADGTPRDVYLAFDSDCTTNAQVHRALEELATLVKGFGSRVRFVVIPPGPNGRKQGLDDFIAAGGTREQLLALAVDDLPPRPSVPGGDIHFEDGDSQTDRLVKLAAANPGVELFHAPGDRTRGFASIRVREHRETHAVDSPGFQHWLTQEFFRRFGKAPGSDALRSAINTIRATCLCGDTQHEVAMRVAGHE